MQTRQLGNSDLYITPLGVGAWAIGGGGWAFAWGPQDDAASIRAIRAALAIRDKLASLDLQMRAGVHTGECELVEGGIGGVAVHIAARVAGLSEPGEVLVSSTVKSLVAGSGIEFADWGTTQLKGVPEEWSLFTVTAK